MRKGLILAFCLAVLLVAPTALRAGPINLITNGGFETGDWTGWTVGYSEPNPDIDIYGIPHSGSYAAEFGQATEQYDSISQTLTTQTGSNYTLGFWLYNPPGILPFTSNPDNDQFQVYWDGALIMDINGVDPNDPQSEYTYYSFDLTGTGSDTVLFQGYDAPSYYNLDDVSLTGNSAATPEPSNLLLMDTGLLGIAVLLRKRLTAFLLFAR
jgi:hypothetical protein